ncbi:macrolide 2'-phosphotransferase [Paenarthrobacter sp. Z7-10]|uniref:macrolide 2'-phosphotransferase n=1 Tax=Paenarthrobacter sp. Z7-10 TaxID=2787635 RepID=UPI0022A940DD|nr:macrolide 2'-phosphotransferase [Paenarthrobacter sp. Z7-10]MCZ2403202.1 macrolide 2'-phosphotransferase [Paenarthrobacter sp. Z7-10]
MTAIELAAVASAAVPGLTPTACAPEPDDAADFDSAMLLDADRKRWRVRSPKHSEASTRLETELLVLRAFSPAIRAELPFLLPTVAGTVRQGDLTTFVYSHLAGQPESVEELAAGGQVMAREVGAAMAAIHDLPPELVNNADLPSYTANEFRQRKLNELDQAATTGKIPASLLRRWEHALEDVALWRFHPCVVHGDLHEDNILVQGGRVLAITGWTDLRIGDPADDFAWLVAVQNHHFVEAVQDAYSAGRKDSPDRHLLRRAALSAEFALAQWLVKGVGSNNAQMIAEAEDMLRTLERDILAYGGQPISTETPEVAPSAPTVAAAHQSPAAGSPAAGLNPAAAGRGATAAVTVEAIAADKPSDAPAPEGGTNIDSEPKTNDSADDGATETGSGVQAVPLESSRPAEPPSA